MQMLLQYDNFLVKLMIKIFLFFLSLWIFSGCASYYAQTYKPDILVEKKIQASRKGEILRDGKPEVIAIATHLNEVDEVIYNKREYFFIEVFSENKSIFLNGLITYDLFGNMPLWVREIKKDEFDEILHPSNRWSRVFLIAFFKLDSLVSRDAKLTMDLYGWGKIIFDFSYQAMPAWF